MDQLSETLIDLQKWIINQFGEFCRTAHSNKFHRLMKGNLKNKLMFKKAFVEWLKSGIEEDERMGVK